MRTTSLRLVNLFSCVSLVFLSFPFLAATDVCGQQTDEFEKLLKFGEFPAAITMAETASDQATRDQMFERVAAVQRGSNTGLSCFSTASRIDNDQRRQGAYNDLLIYARPSSGGNLPRGGSGQSGSNDRDNNGFGGGQNQQGGQGGITAADFDELMDLIQETVDPDSWEQNGGSGRIRPFPSGVFVDSTGTLRKLIRDTSGRLDEIRQLQPQSLDDPSLLTSTPLRKVSLSRLERQLQNLAATGQSIPDDLKHLAGIYQLKYVMLYPDSRDVVIAGPAGPWHYDSIGRAINTDTGMPVLNLDDLVVCLRNARDNGGQFTCSIDPRPENLAAAKTFTETTSLKGRVFQAQLKEVLGKMDVTVDGIDPGCHAAQVIVEADYRMKLVGLGVEEGIESVPDYFSRIHLTEEGQLPPMDQLVRWWFTMNYDSVQTNEDRTIFELNGQGVKLLSESEFWDTQGQRVHTGKSSDAAKGFATDFTAKYSDISNKYPIYAELKNVFDCAIAASLIRREGLDRKVDWNLTYLDGGVNDGMLVYQTLGEAVPSSVDSILGQRVLTHREGRTNRRHTITGFGGGVVFDAGQHTAADKIEVDSTAKLNSSRLASAPQISAKAWAWD